MIGNFSLMYEQAPFMRKSEHNQERRTARRFEVAWDIAVDGADQSGKRFTEAGTLQNLSSRGALFLLRRRIELGESLEVEIRVPMKEKSWMQYSAKVVRVKKHAAYFGVAVNFASARPTFIER